MRILRGLQLHHAVADPGWALWAEAPSSPLQLNDIHEHSNYGVSLPHSINSGYRLTPEEEFA